MLTKQREHSSDESATATSAMTGLPARVMKDMKETLGSTSNRSKDEPSMATKPTGAARRNEILVQQQARMKNSEMMEQYHS